MVIDGARMAVSGIGPERAAAAAQKLLEAGADRLLSWGVAGGLAPPLGAGDLVVPERIVTPRGDRPVDATQAAAVAAALSDDEPIHREPLYSTDELVRTAARCQQLVQQTGAVAVDMEAGAVAASAAAAGVPFVAVKAICDPADFDMPPAAQDWMTPAGRLRPTRLLLAMARRPTMRHDLQRLRRDFTVARRRLATAAPAALAAMSAP